MDTVSEGQFPAGHPLSGFTCTSQCGGWHSHEHSGQFLQESNAGLVNTVGQLGQVWVLLKNMFLLQTEAELAPLLRIAGSSAVMESCPRRERCSLAWEAPCDSVTVWGLCRGVFPPLNG